MKKSLVFLTGFMASGKSTIGPILANTLGWDFYDLDKLIENKTGKKIKDIFASEGEDYFRNLETRVLQGVINFKNTIIALGGGTVTRQSNIDLMKENGILIYLETSPQEAYNRLRFKRDRPVLLNDSDEEPSKDELIKRINDLLKERKKFYNQADIKINTDSFRIGQTIDKLSSIIIKETEK